MVHLYNSFELDKLPKTAPVSEFSNKTNDRVKFNDGIL